MADDSKRPQPGAGDIVIELAGQQLVLSPSLGACKAISKLGGGARPIIARLANQDFELICEVIAMGTGYTSLKERQMIEEAVYQTGTIAVAAECILFVRTVNNGGVIPQDDEEGGTVDPDLPLSQSTSSTTE